MESSRIPIQMMSAVVILSVVKFSRFLVKDKSENTFIKICNVAGHTAQDIAKSENILQRTTLRGVLFRNNIKKCLYTKLHQQFSALYLLHGAMNFKNPICYEKIPLYRL